MSSLIEKQELKGVLSADFAHGYASASYQIEGECTIFEASINLTEITELHRTFQADTTKADAVPASGTRR